MFVCKYCMCGWMWLCNKTKFCLFLWLKTFSKAENLMTVNDSNYLRILYFFLFFFCFFLFDFTPISLLLQRLSNFHSFWYELRRLTSFTYFIRFSDRNEFTFWYCLYGLWCALEFRSINRHNTHTHRQYLRSVGGGGLMELNLK